MSVHFAQIKAAELPAPHTDISVSISSFRHHSTSFVLNTIGTRDQTGSWTTVINSFFRSGDIWGPWGRFTVPLFFCLCLYQFEGVSSGARVAGCGDLGSYIIIQSRPPQLRRWASAVRRKNNKAEYEAALHCMFKRILQRRAGGRAGGAVIGPCALESEHQRGSTLSWTPRVRRVRMTMYGSQPMLLGTSAHGAGSQPRYKMCRADRHTDADWTLLLPRTLHITLRWVVLYAVHGSKVTCRNVQNISFNTF